jgi:hypothetical protein
MQHRTSLSRAIAQNRSEFSRSCAQTRRGMAVALSSFVAANTRRQIATMVGEFLREAGVLIAVLAPLELLVTHGSLTVKGILVIVVLAAPCLVAGVMLGLER